MMSSIIMATISPLGPSSTAVDSTVTTTPSVPPNTTAQLQTPQVNPSTTWRPGQQRCFNYTVNRPCHVGPRCSYYHDEVARQAWLNSSAGKIAMAQRELETPSMASESTGAPYTSVETSPQVQPVFAKLDTENPLPYVKRSRFFGNQDVRLEDPSFVKSMRGDVAIAPAAEKLNAVQETQDNQIEGETSLDASKVALTVPSISETTLGSGIVEEVVCAEQPPAVNTLTTFLPTRLATISEDSVAEDSIVENPIAESSIAENSVAEDSVIKNSVAENSVPENSVTENSVTENSVTEDSKVFGKTEDTCIEQQPLKHTKVARSGSISSTFTQSSFTQSSAALRKAYDITHKVMTFLHRRANSVSAPAPLGEGHPAYDGDSAHPRVNLPKSGHRRVDSNSAPPPLDQDHPAFDNSGAPRVSLPSALVENKVMATVVHETKTPEKPNSHEMIGLSAWKNAALFIEASDRAHKKAEAPAAAAADPATIPATPTKLVTKFKFRLVVESPYGNITSPIHASDTGTQYSVTMAPVVPGIDLGTQPVEEPVTEPVEEPVTEPVEEPVAEAVDKLCLNASEPVSTVIKKSLDAPTNSESNNDDTSTAVMAKKADTCINFVRGRPCKHGRRCPYYHDMALRDAMVLNPSEALLNGIKRSNKGTTSNHNAVKPQSEKKESSETPETKAPNPSDMAETAAIAKCNEVSQQGPRCNAFILGYNCHHKENAYYHDTALRSAFHQAIRDNPYICKNFLLGRDCASSNCKYRHDVVVRDSLKKDVAVDDTAHQQDTTEALKKRFPCKSFVLGYRCIQRNCPHEHDCGLRSALLRLKRDVCKNYLLDTPCVSKGNCQLRHDAKLHDNLMAGYSSAQIAPSTTGNRAGSPLMHKAEKALTPNTSPDRGRSPGSRSVSPENVALATAWNNFTANVAAHDAAEEAAYVALRSSSAASSENPYTLKTIYRERVEESTSTSLSKARDTIIQPTVEQGNGAVDIKSPSSTMDNEPNFQISPEAMTAAIRDGDAASAESGNEAMMASLHDGDVASAESGKEAMMASLHDGDGASAESGKEAMTASRHDGDAAGAESGKEAMTASLHDGDPAGAESGKEAMTASLHDGNPAGAESGKEAEMVAANLAASRVMGGRLCPWFHGNRYECKKGDSCFYRHDHKLQQTYKSKDPRFQSQDLKVASPAFPVVKNCGEPKAISKWAKKTDEAVWSSSAVPMALPTKGKGKFIYFPLLPGEIRLKIWEYVLLTPYSPIVLQFFQNEHSFRPTAKYVNITRTPVALRTCHESRVEALKFYELCLSSPGSPPRTFLDYNTSYVYLCTRRSGYFRPMMKGLAPRDLEHIRYLTLKLRDWFCNDDVEFRDAIWRFKGLKTLQLLVSALKEDEDMRSREAVSRVRQCLKWQVEELNPGWRTPRVVVAVVPGLEADSEPEEYGGPSSRGERIMEFRYQMELSQLFSSAT